MYIASIDRAGFLAEVREHKRIPRVKSLPYASIDGKERGLQLRYEVAGWMRDEKIVIAHDEILLAKLVADDRWIEPRWVVNFGGSLLEELQKENLVYEAEIRMSLGGSR